MNTVKHHCLVFQTDFGYKDSTVAAMYGVVKCTDPTCEIIDSTHELPQFDIWTASYRLWQAMRFWPKGTIFVSVVDPGVGTERKACVARTKDGYYIVTPDNGTLTHVAAYHGIAEVREIDETRNCLNHETSVFHGRDLFGYCAAKLSAGEITFEEVGSEYDVNQIVRFPITEAVYEYGKAWGSIEIDDPNFGNLFTNLSTKKLLENGFVYGEDVHVTIHHQDQVVMNKNIRFDKSFGMVGLHEPIVYNNELMQASFACSQGNFSQMYQVGYGADWKVQLEKIV